MYQLTALPYEYQALEPFIDTETMRLHHDKHHQAYVDKFNLALSNYPELQKISPEELLWNYQEKVDQILPAEIQNAIRNHGGGVVNHNLFWQILSPQGQREPQGKLKEAMAVFGDFAAFKEKFEDIAIKQFGSGWACLVLNENKELELYGRGNQDSPLMEKHQPLLMVDVWEHAYYLKYQNKRKEYLEAIWNILNWEKIAELFQTA